LYAASRLVAIVDDTVCDDRLSPNLSRGRGKSSGGDLDVDEEGSEQNEQTLAITTPRLHWLSIHEHTN
jgi:hypothetical protein